MAKPFDQIIREPHAERWWGSQSVDYRSDDEKIAEPRPVKLKRLGEHRYQRRVESTKRRGRMGHLAD